MTLGVQRLQVHHGHRGSAATGRSAGRFGESTFPRSAPERTDQARSVGHHAADPGGSLRSRQCRRQRVGSTPAMFPKDRTSGQSSWNVDSVVIYHGRWRWVRRRRTTTSTRSKKCRSPPAADPRIKTAGIQDELRHQARNGTTSRLRALVPRRTRPGQSNPTIPARAQSYLAFRNQIDKIEGSRVLKSAVRFSGQAVDLGRFSRSNIHVC